MEILKHEPDHSVGKIKGSSLDLLKNEFMEGKNLGIVWDTGQKLCDPSQ